MISFFRLLKGTMKKSSPVSPAPATTFRFESDERYISSEVGAEMAESEELTSYIWSSVSEHLNGNWGLADKAKMDACLSEGHQVESIFEIPDSLKSRIRGIRIVTDSHRCCTSVWAYTVLLAAA